VLAPHTPAMLHRGVAALLSCDGANCRRLYEVANPASDVVKIDMAALGRCWGGHGEDAIIQAGGVTSCPFAARECGNEHSPERRSALERRHAPRSPNDAESEASRSALRRAWAAELELSERRDAAGRRGDEADRQAVEREDAERRCRELQQRREAECLMEAQRRRRQEEEEMAAAKAMAAAEADRRRREQLLHAGTEALAQGLDAEERRVVAATAAASLDKEDDHQGQLSQLKALEAIVFRLYERFEPSRLGDVEHLFRKYQGLERELYVKICHKFGVEPDPAYVPPEMPEEDEEDAEEEEVEEAEEKADMEEVQARLRAFLKKFNFRGVNARRRRLLSACYPLHVAVERNNAEFAELLIAAGADLAAKNSSGRTPLQLAERTDTNGSHGAVVSVLRDAAAARSGTHTGALRHGRGAAFGGS